MLCTYAPAQTLGFGKCSGCICRAGRGDLQMDRRRWRGALLGSGRSGGRENLYLSRISQPGRQSLCSRSSEHQRGAAGKIRGFRGSLIHEHGAYTARGVNVPYGSAAALTLGYEVPAFRLDIKLALGRIYNRSGILLASVAQEGTIRVPK